MPKANCKCASQSQHVGHAIQSRSRLRPGEARLDVYEGRKVLKVPVVMARSDVVMNGSVIPQEELIPESWDGVPVTWGHPNDGQGFISAQTPSTLTEWSIGRIFNSRVEGPALMAEAWIEIDRAMEVAPGFVETLMGLRRELPVDVSTGYFSKDVEANGEIGGRPYTMFNRDVKPNHLAILVEEEGACNWADGCGLRSNIRGRRKMPKATDIVKLNKKQETALETLKAAIKGGGIKKSDLLVSLFVNERGQDDDRRQIMADLISRDDSPYTPDDEQALMMMSDATLRRMRDDYLEKKNEGEEGDEEKDKDETADEPEDNEGDEEKDEDEPEDNEGDEEKDEDKMKQNAAALPKTRAELTGIIDKVVAASVKKAMPKAMPKAMTVNAKELAKEVAATIMSPELKAALALMTNQVKTHRTELISKIVANSTITKAQAEGMTDETLEVVANGLVAPVPSYAARPIATNEIEDEDDPAVAAMTAHLNIRDELSEARAKKRKAA